jgi:large-conductance mechanosensitive channel
MQKRMGEMIGWALAAFTVAYILSAAFNNLTPNVNNWIIYPLIVVATIGFLELINKFFSPQERNELKY